MIDSVTEARGRRTAARALLLAAWAAIAVGAVGLPVGTAAPEAGSPAPTQSRARSSSGSWLLKGALLWSDGLGFVRDGAVAVDDGRVVAVGADLEAAPGATVLDFPGGTILPGFIEAHTQIGLHGDGVGWDTDEDTTPITADLNAIDAYYPFAADVEAARRGGVTTALVSPGGKNLIGGSAVLLKTAGVTRDQFVIRQPAALKLSLGEEPKRDSSAPRTRMAELAMLRQHFAQAAAYEDRRSEALARGQEFEADPDFEVTAAVLRCEIPALVQAYRAQDISNALRLSQELGFDVQLAYGTEAFELADELAQRKVPVILTAIKGLWYRFEKETFHDDNAARLIAAGVPLALQLGEGNPYGYGDLLFNDAYLLKSGVSEEDALRAITSWPAAILDADDRVGRLSPGLDADVVVLSGAPFDPRTEVLHVFIEGRSVFERR